MTAVAIVGAGAVTPIGLSLAETAASARARVARLREIDWMDRRFEPFIVGRVPDDGLPPLHDALAARHLTYREARMLRLAHVALEEALADAGLPPFDDAHPLPMLLALPEHHTTLPIDPPKFLQRLALQAGVTLDLRSSSAAPRGRAAGLMALQQAAARLARGEAKVIAVAGVDTLVDPYVLGTLDLQGRVRNEVNSDGFTPAEGAAVLVLAGAELVEQLALQPRAWLHASASGSEAGHLYAEDAPYRGEGLTAVFETLFQKPPPAPVASVWASFNGERYWAREYGVARLRHAGAFDPDHAIEHPAECFGDLGAAHGVVLAAIACEAMAAGWRRAPSLVFASSDHADRAAALLTSQPH